MLSDPLYDLTIYEQTKAKLLSDLIQIDQKITETQQKIYDLSAIEEPYPAIIVAEVLKRFKTRSSTNDMSKIYLIDKNGEETLIYSGGYCSTNNSLNKELMVSDQELAAFHKLGFKLKYQLSYHCA